MHRLPLLTAALVVSLSAFACSSDSSDGGGSSGGASGAGATAGSGASGGSGGGGASGGSGGTGGSAGTAGSAGAGGGMGNVDCQLPQTVTMTMDPLFGTSSAGIGYDPANNACEIVADTQDGNFNVLQIAADPSFEVFVFDGWEFVSVSHGSKVGDTMPYWEMLPADTDVTIEVKQTTGSITLRIVVSLSGLSVTVKSMSTL